MCVTSLHLQVSTYVGEGVDQICTPRTLTERDFTPTQLAALGHIISHAGRDPAPPRTVPVLVSHPALPKGHRPEAPLVQVTGDRAAAARQQGYTGEACNDCGSFAVKRTGKCTTCEACGATGGCG